MLTCVLVMQDYVFKLAQQVCFARLSNSLTGRPRHLDCAQALGFRVYSQADMQTDNYQYLLSIGNVHLRDPSSSLQ